MIAHALRLARAAVDQNPTDGQKEAGNYRKGHIIFHGLPITIENPKGSIRSGVDTNGKRWSCVLPADYGYVKRTEGADGDHLDVFIGPDHKSQQVFIINQVDHRTRRFDEHKAILGVSSAKEAVKLYEAAFSDGHGADRIGSIEPMPIDAFKHWLKYGNTFRRASTRAIVLHALSKS